MPTYEYLCMECAQPLEVVQSFHDPALTECPACSGRLRKVFGNVGNQYVERFANYGIPQNNYWDWQLGAVVSVYGFDISAAYTDTNVDVQGCLNTQNCQGRIILGISKAF